MPFAPTQIAYKWTDTLDKYAGGLFVTVGFWHLSQKFMDSVVIPALNYPVSTLMPSIKDPFNTVTDVATGLACIGFSAWLGKRFADKSYWGNKLMRSMENAAKGNDRTNEYVLREPNPYPPTKDV